VLSAVVILNVLASIFNARQRCRIRFCYDNVMDYIFRLCVNVYPTYTVTRRGGSGRDFGQGKYKKYTGPLTNLLNIEFQPT